MKLTEKDLRTFIKGELRKLSEGPQGHVRARPTGANFSNHEPYDYDHDAVLQKLSSAISSLKTLDISLKSAMSGGNADLGSFPAEYDERIQEDFNEAEHLLTRLKRLLVKINTKIASGYSVAGQYDENY